MNYPLENLEPNTRFRLGCEPAVTGTLLHTTPCCATVAIDGGVRDVTIEDRDGEIRTFRASRSRKTTWSLGTMVEPIGMADPVPAGDEPAQHPEEDDMATKTKKRSAKKPAAPKAKKVAKAMEKIVDDIHEANGKAAKREKKPKADDGKLSCIDAAAKVLADHGQPMNTKEMIEAMAAKGLWTSPGGKTPAATLYSAILREIDVKGKDSRFTKTERGKFGIKA